MTQITVPVMGLEGMLFQSQTWDFCRQYSRRHLAFKAFLKVVHRAVRFLADSAAAEDDAQWGEIRKKKEK